MNVVTGLMTPPYGLALYLGSSIYMFRPRAPEPALSGFHK